MMGKIRDQKGISLAETLVTVLIFSVAFVAITSGMSAALKVYKDVREKADAESLLSTSINAIAQDLYVAEEPAEAGTSSSDWVSVGSIYSSTRKLSITYVNESSSDGSSAIYRSYEDGSSEPLVADKTQTLDLYAVLSSDGIAYKDGCFRFTVQVYSDKDPSKAVEQQETIIRSAMILDQ